MLLHYRLWHLRASCFVLAFLVSSVAFFPASFAANVNAPQGGTFNINLKGEPTTLHPITSADLFSQQIKEYVIDRLLVHDPETYALVPALAEKYEVAKDGKSFTFTLRKNAKFSDGQPVTAEDVKFSFDAIFEPKFGGAHLQAYFENFDKVEIIDPLTVRVLIKRKYFGNLEEFASDFFILPKHIYGDAESSRKLNKTMFGSGPYKIESYDQGQSIVLVRNHDWWGNELPQFKGKYNFEHIRARFIKQSDVALEMLKKGELDYQTLLPEDYAKKTDGPEWGKTVFKEKVENLSPKQYLYIGWNLRRDLFKDRDVRLALYHLLNREEMNKKFRFDLSYLATGPWYVQSEYADPKVKPVLFDSAKAVALLKKAGWVHSEKDGVLEKTVNGKKVEFRFTLQYVDKDSEKYMVMYQNDLKKYGIDMQLQLLEWTAMLKNMDESSFDAVWAGWGAGDVDLDPKQVWHSESAVKGGSNHIGYKNPEVDRLIDQARLELDKKKRIPLMRKIYKTIAEDVPYAFLFVDRYKLYAHTARMKMQKPTMHFGTPRDGGVGYDYWWTEEAKPAK
jgi:microcin C transport system substrate-binding protein